MRIDEHTVLSNAIEYAIRSGMNKCDKYSDVPLTETQKNLLIDHIENYFFVGLDEQGIVLDGNDQGERP